MRNIFPENMIFEKNQPEQARLKECEEVSLEITKKIDGVSNKHLENEIKCLRMTKLRIYMDRVNFEISKLM